MIRPRLRFSAALCAVAFSFGGGASAATIETALPLSLGRMPVIPAANDAVFQAPVLVKALSEGSPAQVAQARAALAVQAPRARAAVLAQARAQVRSRLDASLSASKDDGYHGAPALSAYDDLLRLLSFKGVFDGQVLYPLSGADYLPARWGELRAVNWDDHRGLYRRMAKALGRPDLAKPMNASWRTVGNVFDTRAFSKTLPPPPASGPRTLLLKHADGYREDDRLDRAARGVFDGVDLSGVVGYKAWLKFVLDESLRAGDYVVLLSRDAIARRALENSGRFSRVETGAPDLSRMPADLRSIIHLDGQALYAPNALSVYRKNARKSK